MGQANKQGSVVWIVLGIATILPLAVLLVLAIRFKKGTKKGHGAGSG
jgi:hypothetical protein